MRIKVKNIKSNINVFGGINPILLHIDKLGISQLMDEVLGKRPKQAKYSKSDILVFWMLSQFCGINKLERVWKTAENFKKIPQLKDKIPSPDTIILLMKSLSAKTKIVKSGLGIINEVNYNQKMNQLLLKVINVLNIIDTKKKHTLDIDTVCIPTKVKDAKHTYKKFLGYNPAVCTIDGTPVLLEMRNGNVSPRFGLKTVLINSFKELEKQGIKINKVRIDGAGYNRKITSYLDSLGKIFYIRANRNTKRDAIVKKHDKWRPVEIPISNGKKLKGEIISLEELFNEHRDLYRVITTRHKKKGCKKGEYPYLYRSIVTNDFKTKPEDIVRFYNMRGKEERAFDVMRNDFGWKYPPFSDMAQNTVSYIISMITHAIYKYIIKNYSSKTDKLEPTMRLETFTKLFVIIASEIFIRKNFLEYVFHTESFDFKKFMSNKK